jgi:hypothetical protein
MTEYILLAGNWMYLGERPFSLTWQVREAAH